MNVADIVIVILAIVFAFVGFKKGLLKRITAFAAWFGSIFLASIFQKPVLMEIMKDDSPISLVKIHDKFSLWIQEWFLKKGDIFSEKLSGVSADIVKESLSDAGIPGFLHKYFLNNIDSVVEESSNIIIADYFGNVVGTLLMSILVFGLLFLIIFIFLRIIAHYIDKIRDVFIVGTVDGVLGALYSLLKYAFVLMLIFLGLSFITSGTKFGNNIYNYISPYLGLDEKGFSICKYLYYENPLLKLISSISLDKLIGSIV